MFSQEIVSTSCSLDYETFLTQKTKIGLGQSSLNIVILVNYSHNMKNH